ncbi:BnaA04g29080D [Brassica napus]|uniref:BnaA04g29080D protein n=4 Tax=Brassica TaxID=3705 RepID=A0A078IZD8_BRANA|nr:BnaA04g29080D [Brassica napus]
MEAFNEHGVGTFDVVVINLYPFYDKVTAPGGISFEDGIENIDIGGAAMIKAVAKNHKDVLIVVDSEDYQAVLEYLKGAQNDQKFRRKSAWKAFQHIAAYDSAVSEWLWKQTEGRRSRCSGFQLCWIPAVSVLRYGVELAVADKSDEAVYVGSGGEITKLTNIRAAEAGHLHTFTISSIFNKRNCPPVPDFVVDGVSSLTINVCAGPPDNENEPAGETTAGGASVTNLLIPTSLKQLRRHALHRLKRIVVSHGVGS